MGALLFMGYIQGEGRQQSSLFPPTLEELVPEDHLVRVIEAYVARLPRDICRDLSSNKVENAARFSTLRFSPS